MDIKVDMRGNPCLLNTNNLTLQVSSLVSSLMDKILRGIRKNDVEYLTNRFHIAMRLFSNRSQMTSKCGKNNEVARNPQVSVSQTFLPHFDVLWDLQCITEQTQGNMKSICFIQ